MIKLSESLSTFVRRELKINEERTSFTEQELANVSYASITKDDMKVIKYFKHLSVLNLDHFPSLTSEDIEYIGRTIPSIISLKVKEQNSIYNLDLSSFNNLVELALIHNDNLVNISGMKKVKRLTFYDNKEFKNIQQIVDYLNSNKDASVVLDFIYYIDLKRELLDEEIFKRINWVESLGLRQYKTHEYSNDEIDYVMQSISKIVSKYLYVFDSPLEKFSILYKWMIDHIKFVNEDENEYSFEYDNTYKVLNNLKAGRLSYARTFQILLEYAGIKSTLVYSFGAKDAIGFFNGNKVFSLFGESDYVLLRVLLNGRSYYSDIAWDSLTSKYKYADALRLFLASKEELSLRHKFVGEGNVINSYSYNGDDSDDLLMFASYRIKDVDKLFDEIAKIDSSILSCDIEQALIDSIVETKEINNTFTFDGEKENLLLSVKSCENKKENLKKNKKNLIDLNRRELINNYIGEGIDKTNIMKCVQLKKDSYLISDTLYEILSLL